MRCDIHLHLDERMIEILSTLDIMALISCATPIECEQAKAFMKLHKQMSMSSGLHPWHVENTSYEAMLPYLEESAIIGEIGLDNEWCTSDEKIQILRFEQQLSYACKAKKPVILHTKGKEKEIANMIVNYPNTYLVHWYSCMDYLELYKELDCYFSVGPSIDFDEAVQQVVKEIGMNRLLIESDGISAIEWAIHHSIKNDEYVLTLDHTAKRIGECKGYTVEEVWKQVNQNYMKFMKVK